MTVLIRGYTTLIFRSKRRLLPIPTAKKICEQAEPSGSANSPNVSRLTTDVRRKMNATHKRLTKFTFALLGAYITVFAILWLGGGYILTESGEVRQFLGISTGIAAPDIADWQPLFGHCQPEYHWATGDISPRCDILGWAYYPLWILVRKSHPPVRLLSQQGEIIQKPSLPITFRINPLRGGDLKSVLSAETN